MVEEQRQPLLFRQVLEVAVEVNVSGMQSGKDMVPVHDRTVDMVFAMETAREGDCKDMVIEQMEVFHAVNDHELVNTVVVVVAAADEENRSEFEDKDMVDDNEHHEVSVNPMVNVDVVQDYNNLLGLLLSIARP